MFQRWGGAAATIVPSDGDHVWGVLWEVEDKHLATLDKQEGVPNIYNRIEVTGSRQTDSPVVRFTAY